MKYLNIVLIFGAILLCINPTKAQQTISGTIIDAQTGEAIPGVQIVEKTGTSGAASDINGNFSFQSSSDSVTISCVGYASITVAANSQIGEVALVQSITNLNQIVVSASRDRQERKDAPMAITSIQPQLIEETKATSADQLLNKVSGVYMSDLGNEQHMMAIRQPISTKSIFLYVEDGIPIRTSGLFNHNALLEMNMAATRTMEIIRGPSSSLYGSEAIGGAINFITYQPSVNPMGKVSVQGNNIGYRRGDLLLSNTFNKVGVLVAGYYANRTDGYREHSDFSKLALTAKVNYQISDKMNWSNSLSYIDYVSDMTGSLDSANFFDKNYKSLQSFTNRDVTALRFKSQLDMYWNADSKTSVAGILRDNSVKQNPSYRIKDDFKPWTGSGDPNLAHSEVNDNSFTSYAMLIQHRQAFKFLNSSIIAGLSTDYSPSTYHANYISVFKDDEGVYQDFVESDSVLTNYEVDLFNLGAYTQFSINPTERLTVLGALRYDRFNYDYRNNLDSLAFSGAPNAVNSFEALTPKVGLTYDLGKSSGFYANYTQGFVPPQVGELYRGVTVPSLEPSVFINYEAGMWISLLNGKMGLDAAVYQLEGTNEIISVLQDDGSRENQNAGKTMHTGVEYGLNYAPSKQFSLRFSGSNATHTFVDYIENGSEFNDNDMAGAPSWIANAEFTYRPKFIPNFRIGAEWQHVDGYFMDAANTKEYDGHDQFNIRVGYSVKQVEAWFNVMNVSDELYATTASKSTWGESYNPGDPRTFNVGLAYKFKPKKK